MEEERRKAIYQKIYEQFFRQFDTFLIGKWTEAGTFSEKERDRAYLNFYKQVKKDKVADRQTIRKWFGLGGSVIPKREQIFKLAFSLGLSVEETEEYLQFGISEPGFQINDYSECIVMYCLENGLTEAQYLDMVTFFERHSARQGSEGAPLLEQTAHTERLLQEFEQQKTLSREEFLHWMCKNTSLFKGYSMLTYRTYTNLMDEVLIFVREEERKNLFRFLEKTDFSSWAKENGISEKDYGEAVRQYIKNLSRRKNCPLTSEELREVKQSLVIGYSSKSNVNKLLSEVYNWNLENHKEVKREIGNINAKYISDLLGISLHKERLLKMNQALAELEQMPEKEPCPSWVEELIEEKNAGFKETKKHSVAEAAKLLVRDRVMQRQRVRNIQRSDLLLLIQYICQKKYYDRISEQGVAYSAESAKQEFVDMANPLLEACGMRPVDGAYRLDYILLACFEEEDGVLFAEVFEE